MFLITGNRDEDIVND